MPWMIVLSAIMVTKIVNNLPVQFIRMVEKGRREAKVVEKNIVKVERREVKDVGKITVKVARREVRATGKIRSQGARMVTKAMTLY